MNKLVCVLLLAVGTCASAGQPVEVSRKAVDYAVGAVKFSKSSMRDPDSFVLEGALVNPEGTVVCTSYRSKNGFGGYNKGISVTIKAVQWDDDPVRFQKYCLNKKKVLLNVTELVTKRL